MMEDKKCPNCMLGRLRPTLTMAIILVANRDKSERDEFKVVSEYKCTSCKGLVYL